MRRLLARFAVAWMSLGVAAADEKAAARGECDAATVTGLNRRVAKRWPGTEVRSCAAGKFGAAGYVVNVAGDKLQRAGILAKDGGKDLVAFTDVPMHSVATSIVGYGAVDLDGDGVDEVI